MKQLDFTDCEPLCTADRQARHDALWGPLDEVRRAATRVACDFFAFADEVQWQMCLHRHHAKDDAEGIQRLDRIVEYSRKSQWVIFPAWWTKDPRKSTAYFIGQLKVHAGQYAEYLAKRREEAEKKAEAKRKGGAA